MGDQEREHVPETILGDVVGRIGQDQVTALLIGGGTGQQCTFHGLSPDADPCQP